MITFHVESYDTSYKDIQKLYMIHWKEISKFSFEANIDWDLFAKLYALGNLFIATARKNERMIGYFISYMFPHIRYKDKIFADNDTIFILPEYREGWTGYKFIKFACTELKKTCDVITLRFKASNKTSIIAKRLGFSLADNTYILEV